MNTLRNHFWSLLLTLFFAVLLFGGMGYLASIGAFNRNVSIPDFFLMSLAVWRLVRLFTYDAIMQFVRDWFIGADARTLRGSIYALLNCPWCTGLWFGATVVFFYFLTPYAWPIILVLAIAAVGSFFQVLSNLVGWNAEYKKRQTLALQSPSDTKCG